MIGADSGPWARPTHRRVLLGQGAAIVLGAMAWMGANAQDAVRAQLLWVNLAIVASLIGGTAQAWWLLRGRRAVSLRRRTILRRLGLPEAGVTSAHSAEPASAPSPGEHADVRVMVTGSSWYHLPTCLLVQGKRLIVLDDRRGLEPCAVCGG